jgi:hypothetical protein
VRGGRHLICRVPLKELNRITGQSDGQIPETLWFIANKMSVYGIRNIWHSNTVFGLPHRYLNWCFVRMTWQHQLLKYWKSYTVDDSTAKYYLGPEIVRPTQTLGTYSWKCHDRTSASRVTRNTLFPERVLRNASAMDKTFHVTEWKQSRHDKQLIPLGKWISATGPLWPFHTHCSSFYFSTLPFAEVAHTPP